MKITMKIKKFCAGFMALALVFFMGAGFPALEADAASGTIYSCSINPCYAHPVSGEIEDSGGPGSYETGQGMVEGAIYPTGMLEMTDSGEYYLTIRMGLADFTSDHGFMVQNIGDTGWMETAVGVTAQGSDSNGTNMDVCIQVPSSDCIVRFSMYVDPMGRPVIGYLYPSNFTEGNSVGMTATIVTEPSGSGAGAEAGSYQPQYQQAQPMPQPSQQQVQPQPNQQQAQPNQQQPQPNQQQAQQNQTKPGAPQSSITEPAKPTEAAPSAEEGSLNSAQGLSLSTSKGKSDAKSPVGDAENKNEKDKSEKGSSSVGSFVLKGIIVVICTLIVMAAGLGMVYIARKNWDRWGR